MDIGILAYITALGGGILSIASPCVLPLLPGVMAYSTERSKLTPVAIVLGLILSFTIMEVVTSAFIMYFYDYLDIIKLVSGVLIAVMGFYMLSETIENLILRVWQKVPLSRVSASRADDGGLLGGVLLGASLGIVWIPCIGPILGSILLVIGQEGNFIYGTSLIFTYSLGLAIPMLAIAYSSNFLSSKIRTASKYTRIVRKAGGFILVLLGLYFLIGALI